MRRSKIRPDSYQARKLLIGQPPKNGRMLNAEIGATLDCGVDVHSVLSIVRAVLCSHEYVLAGCNKDVPVHSELATSLQAQ